TFKYSTIDVGDSAITTRNDTILSVREFIRNNVDIIVFVGGDGTARDVYEGLKGNEKIPILGIPAGVKMHSGVFASTPEAGALLLSKFLKGEAKIVEGEILDVDEEEYRKGRYVVKLYYITLTVASDNLLAPSKDEISYEEAELEEIADYVIENLKNDIFYILGPGSTVKYIEKKLGIYNTNFLSVDIVKNKQLIKSNANYFDLLDLTGELKIILTPIGKQGFILGRGNQEIGPKLLQKINKTDIIIISPLKKVYTIDCLRIDTGDKFIDEKLSGIYNIIVGYNKFYAIKTCY
ncbi:ATP-NAD kinase, partial [Sulfolobus sp. E3]